VRIIISPAKKMSVDEDSLQYSSLPVFLEDSTKIMRFIQSLTYEQAKKLWKANDNITKQNIERFADMSLTKMLTPAIFSYEGIQYQHISPSSLEDNMIEYIQKNLRILSGFYGVLKPMDGVSPYRLEMQAKTDIDNVKGLYDFWGRKLYDEVIDESRIIINLASKEYSKSIEKYIQSEDKYISISFYEISKGKLVQKGTYAKMARGEMIRFMAENNVQDIEDIKKFNFMGYRFEHNISNENEYVFVK
jgi:UPF0246 protein EUBREC_1226